MATLVLLDNNNGILLRLFLTMIGLEGTHKVILQGLLGHSWRRSLMMAHLLLLLLQNIDHYLSIDWSLRCSPSNQASCLYYLGWNSGGNHVRDCFLRWGPTAASTCSSACPHLPTGDHSLIRRRLVKHVRKGKIIGALQRHCIHCIILVVLAVPRVSDTR